MAPKHKFICIGHRGAAGHEPENTLISFERACQLGVDYIELDVWYSDGQIICIHDEMLERTTNGHGSHRKLKHTQLKALDAGKGQKIPTLAEVIELVHGRAKIMIEFKDALALEPALQLLSQLHNEDRIKPENFVLQSFDLELVRIAHEVLPHFPRACLFKNPVPKDIQRALQLKAQAIHVNFDKLSKPVLSAAHAADLKVYVYTVNQPEKIHSAVSMGVDGITSDYPDRLIELAI